MVSLLGDVQTISVPRQRAVAALLSRIDPTKEGEERRHFRHSDPTPTTVGQLCPENFGHPVVIRSGDFLGTVYGTLTDVHPHPGWAQMTTVELLGKKPLTFRSDTEALVLE